MVGRDRRPDAHPPGAVIVPRAEEIAGGVCRGARPSGADRCLVVVDLHGKRVSGDHEPSYDVLVHCTVYRERPTINAVMHTEPPYATAFGTVGLEIDAITTTGLKSANGTVPIMPFGSIRKEAFALDMLARMGERHAIVWGNHGVLVVAPSIQQALDRSMGVEFNAQVAAVARALGKPHSLAYLDASVVLA